MRHPTRSEGSPELPRRRPPVDGANRFDEARIGVLVEAVVRRAGHDHWVASRDERRWCGRLAMASLAVVAMLGVLGAPHPVGPVVASAAVVPVLVWADVASRAWRLRAQHVAEVERILGSMRTHLAGADLVAMLVDGGSLRSGDVGSLRAAAIAAIDQAGCRAGHSPLCPHRRRDTPHVRA